MQHKIRKIDVHLVSYPITGGFADATRKVETIGFLLVRVTTDQGLEGVGVTYHEVGGEATRDLILRNMAPKLIGRDPLETEAIWQEFFHYLRGVGRKGLMYCALIKFKVGFDGGRAINRAAVRVRKVREAVGPDIRILVDANNCFDAATAVQLANRIREFDIALFEEPVFADDIPGLARFKRGTDIPLATGEHEYTKFGVRDLLLAEAADIVQVDGARAGGYTEMLKCAALTQAWNVKFAPHAMENVHLHLVAAVPNALFLERLLMFEEITGKVFKDAPAPIDGFMYVPDRPGLALDLDMDFVKSHEDK